MTQTESIPKTGTGNSLRGLGSLIDRKCNSGADSIDSGYQGLSIWGHNQLESARGIKKGAEEDYNNFLEKGRESGKAYTNWVTPKVDAINNAPHTVPNAIAHGIGYGINRTAYETGRGINCLEDSGIGQNFKKGLNGEAFAS